MKGYILLDIPKGCHECKVMFRSSYSEWCGASQKDEYGFNEDVYKFVRTRTRPDWCPIREFPVRPKKTICLNGDDMVMIW